ncbi:unnamed protein product [Ostreobium quekettii]|uniref:BZIP domain-containing protein n=1 Tax=Ostreobium quekettii TaxID=121088 RepID=A0A8S1ISL3_9CHLO|nr:unnamed protein product [Ostreobium quekettii]
MSCDAANLSEGDFLDALPQQVLLVTPNADATAYEMWRLQTGGTEGGPLQAPATAQQNVGILPEGWTDGCVAGQMVGFAPEVAMAEEGRDAEAGGEGGQEDEAERERRRRERNRQANKNFRERQKQKIADLESEARRMRDAVKEMEERNEVLKKENEVLMAYAGIGQHQRGPSHGESPASTYEQQLDQLLN